MKILTAGSFINLENDEKIERLKNTAQELAKAAAEQTEGLTGDTDAGKKLGLELWQGLEYMCRDAEKGAIRNIFLTVFLERLKSLRPINSSAKQDPLPDEAKPNDEFLGVVDDAPETDEEIIEAETRAVIAGYSQLSDETSAPAAEVIQNEFEQNEIARNKSSVNSTEISPPPESGIAWTASEIESTETAPEAGEQSQEETNAKLDENRANQAIQIPEKEPYNFARCTVTATVQLLPVSEGNPSRKAVLSIRTHDFAPQIQMVEISAENSLTAELASNLERVFEKYKSDLPLRVMDKLKKEKSSRKNPTKTKSNSPVETARSESKQENAGETLKTSAEETGAKESVSPTVAASGVQTAQTGAAGQQGSLF